MIIEVGNVEERIIGVRRCAHDPSSITQPRSETRRRGKLEEQMEQIIILIMT